MPELATLTRAAWSLTRHLADADDLVQHTLLRAYRSFPNFDGRHPRAWLLTIMRNAQVSRGRGDCRHPPRRGIAREARGAMTTR